MTALLAGATLGKHLRKPRESSCPAAPIAAARHRQPF
jgi:hypothetical protein